MISKEKSSEDIEVIMLNKQVRARAKLSMRLCGNLLLHCRRIPDGNERRRVTRTLARRRRINDIDVGVLPTRCHRPFYWRTVRTRTRVKMKSRERSSTNKQHRSNPSIMKRCTRRKSCRTVSPTSALHRYGHESRPSLVQKNSNGQPMTRTSTNPTVERKQHQSE